MDLNTDFVTWFRSVTPYINVFRDKTFVIAFSNEMVNDEKFVDFIHDINLLASLGVHLVLTYGLHTQITFPSHGQHTKNASTPDLKIIDHEALQGIKAASGRIHLDISAQLSMGLPNSPMANAAIRVASGNFITARPIGIINGIDLMYAGKVRRTNTQAIRARLEQGEVVLVSPLGYSPTGEIFSLSLDEISTEVAVALNADKLIFLTDEPLDTSDQTKPLSHELTVADCKELLQENNSSILPQTMQLLRCAIRACENHVHRTHLISRHIDGAIVQELFTHRGIGTMISNAPLQSLRNAKIEDIGGILHLIQPLENEGILVKRSRELLEIEINCFTILEHDGMVIGCAALYPFLQERVCELACFAIHPDHRNTGYGNMLLKHIETKTIAMGIRKLFVLTTHATHWFIEHGYTATELSMLPDIKQHLYNYQRRSKVFMKNL